MGNIKKSIRPGQCYYEPYGRGYRIYRCVANSDCGFVARPVEGEPTYRDREEAKSRVYELNGWETHARPRGEINN